MDQPNLLIEFVKALARRQARIDAMSLPPSYIDDQTDAKDRKAK